MRIFAAFIPAIAGRALGFSISTKLLHGERLTALEARVKQLESATKAQALLNQGRVQLREP